MKLFAFILIALCFADCVSSRDGGKTETVANKTGNGGAAAANENSKGNAQTAAGGGETRKASENLPSRAECANVRAGDKAVLAKQTFPVDFEPFRRSCFVTAYNPEYDEPPLDSEFAIYTDGKEVFKFPNQFNGVTTGCWVEAAAFQDLNADNLTDVIIAGMCSAKSAPYSENMVYVNTGKAFVTDETANYKLQDFKRIKDIADYVKNNQSAFFK